MLHDESKLPADIDPLLTIAQTRQVIPAGLTKIYEMIKAGDLKTVPIGRRQYVRTSSVRRVIEKGAA